MALDYSNTGEEMPEKKKCSNCAYYRVTDHCSQFAVCSDWRYAPPIPEHYPTAEEERRRQWGSFWDRG